MWCPINWIVNLLHQGLPGALEFFQGFDRREACGFDAVGDGTVLAQGGFAFGELGEIIEVGSSFRAASVAGLWQ
jgi:hypothetical protein